MKQLCKICGYQYEATEELEFDELDPSGRRWNEKNDSVCDTCKEDMDFDI